MINVTDGGNGGQPACPEKWKRCRKKKRRQNMNSNINVIYIHVCFVSCNVVVMFACTLMRSHPDSRRHFGVKLEPYRKQLDTELGMATGCMLIRRGQNGVQSMPGTRP
jgi:hypothetical protein